MALACKCDRCGTLFELHDDGNVKNIRLNLKPALSSSRGRSYIEELDLCDDCYSDLISWIEEKDCKNQEEEKRNE